MAERKHAWEEAKEQVLAEGREVPPEPGEIPDPHLGVEGEPEPLPNDDDTQEWPMAGKDDVDDD